MNHLRRSNGLRLLLAVWVVIGGMTAAGWRSEALGAAAYAADGAAHATPASQEGTVSSHGPGPIALSNVTGVLSNVTEWVEEARGAGDLGGWGVGLSALAGRSVLAFVVSGRKPSSPSLRRSGARLHVLCVYRL